MHPFTEERMRQDYEYEQALLADIERERLEEERLEEERLKEERRAKLEDDEVSDSSSDDAPPPLTIEEMRAKRLQFFSFGPSSAEHGAGVKKLRAVQCVQITRKGLRCKKRAKENDLCHIHLRCKPSLI